MISDLARKLGIRPGQVVCLLDAPPGVAEAIRGQCPPGVVFTASPGGVRCDLILFWPDELAGLGERFKQLQLHIVPDGAIWAIMPKKKFARARRVGFTWEQMQVAGLQTDLVDNKIASIFEEEYGTRFVIRKEKRNKYTP